MTTPNDPVSALAEALCTAMSGTGPDKWHDRATRVLAALPPGWALVRTPPFNHPGFPPCEHCATEQPTSPSVVSPPDSPFRKVVDDLTNGCGCACHTGLGYRSSCDHCFGSGGTSVVRTEPDMGIRVTPTPGGRIVVEGEPVSEPQTVGYSCASGCTIGYMHDGPCEAAVTERKENGE